MIDINQLSAQTYECAQRRGKYNLTQPQAIIRREECAQLLGEVIEFTEAYQSPAIVSPHCPTLTAESEELADVAIVLLSIAKRSGIDLENAILTKIQYNETR